MIRRGIAAFVIATMAIGLFAAHSHADTGTGAIVNIGVTPQAINPGGAVFYRLCVVAPQPAPPGAEVAVLGPDGTYQTAVLAYVGSCGGSSYEMQGQLSGGATQASGTYLFQSACVFPPLNPDHTPVYLVPCVDRKGRGNSYASRRSPGT